MAIFLALYFKNVLLSLFGGIVLGVFLLQGYSVGDTFVGVYELFISLLSEAWILKTLAFAILVGSVMELLERSGAVEHFVAALTQKQTIFATKKGALLLPFFIGVVIFIESSITSLIAGAVGKPLCNAQKIPAAKLALVCDSTAAPVSSLILFNGWGALLLGLISTQIEDGIIGGDGVALLMESVVYNFYALSAVLVVFITITKEIDLGAMKNIRFTPMAQQTVSASPSLAQLLLPIFVMVGGVFFYLYQTGSGDILQGSGSTSIFYTMLTTLAFLFVYYVFGGVISTKEYISYSLSGAKKLFGIAMVLLFAFGIGKVTSQMHTGLYLASFASENIDVVFLAALIFLLSGVMAFSTGTSWGTFSIMIPIAVPMAVTLGADVALVIAAVVSGGVFGDHCSPISDTTIISSMASGCDVLEHVKTQLPYALLSGAVAFSLFVVFGLLKS